MHPNPIYRPDAHAQNLAFARARGFGVLALNGAETPLISHIPFLLNDDGKSAELHLVRSNPIARTVKTPTKATIIISGPDGYISPDWYGIDDQVPTWNYIAVHLIGELHPLPQDEITGVLKRLSHANETQLAPKPIWKIDKLTQQTTDKFLRMILPYRFVISDIQATWKLNQNKPDEVRLDAAQSVENAALRPDAASLAAHMRQPPK